MFDDGSRPEPADAPWNAASGDWSEWLRVSRHGGDARYAAALQPQLDEILGGLLDHAELTPGQTVADIGCGEGFAGFGALERIGAGKLIFADASRTLVAGVRAQAECRGVADRCRFVTARAESLTPIPDGCADVVLVRAVLAYVADKPAALRECARILRPGGRISIAEPIFADRAFALAGMAHALAVETPGPATRRLELLWRFGSAYFPADLDEIRRSPLTNYDERDLLRMLDGAGFERMGVRLHIDCLRAPPMPWKAFLGGAPYAGAPPAGEVLEARFTPAERIEFERAVRPDLETGRSIERNVNAYLFARLPERLLVV